MKIITFTLSSLLSLSALAQIESNMIAHFPFNGNLNDISTSAIATTNNGSTYTTDRNGVSNEGLAFNGSTSYFSFNDNDVKTPLPITISVWVKFNNFDYYQPIFGSDCNFENYYGYWMNVAQTTGQISLSISGGLGGSNSSNRRTFTSDMQLNTDTWYHVVGIINAYNDMEIYVDCANTTGTYSGTGSTTMAYSSADSRVGHDAGNNWNPNGIYLDGSLDQLIIWNRELSLSEIQTACNTNNTLNTEELESNTLENAVIFPNPTNDFVTINLDEKLEQCTVVVYDLQGKIVLNSSHKNTSEITLDLKDLDPQVYIIELNSKGRKRNYRVSKN